MNTMHYDRDGTPLGAMEWAEKFEQGNYKRVAWTDIQVGGEVKWRVSTVWMGLDHSFGDGPPLIFETMVFPADGYGDEDVERYSTEDAARAGHEDMVNTWLARTPDSVAVSR